MTFLCIKACRSWRALEVEVWSSVVCLVRNTCEMLGGLRDAQGSLCWAEIALIAPAVKTPESPALSLSTALFLSKERNTNFSVLTIQTCVPSVTLQVLVIPLPGLRVSSYESFTVCSHPPGSAPSSRPWALVCYHGQGQQKTIMLGPCSSTHTYLSTLPATPHHCRPHTLPHSRHWLCRAASDF